MRHKLKRKIEVYCAENGITQTELAKQISNQTDDKISVATLNKWIKGTDTLHINKLINVMKYLNITVEDMENN